jgi:hypothetical protein
VPPMTPTRTAYLTNVSNARARSSPEVGDVPFSFSADMMTGERAFADLIKCVGKLTRRRNEVCMRNIRASGCLRDGVLLPTSPSGIDVCGVYTNLIPSPRLRTRDTRLRDAAGPHSVEVGQAPDRCKRLEADPMVVMVPDAGFGVMTDTSC